jgi:hypothetical protein
LYLAVGLQPICLLRPQTLTALIFYHPLSTVQMPQALLEQVLLEQVARPVLVMVLLLLVELLCLHLQQFLTLEE